MHALLALFVRSLRTDTRSTSLIWTRLAMAGGIFFIYWYIGLGTNPAPGLACFELLVWMNFAFVSLAGLSYFASAITEEKEEGMLSLLRMTDLSPFAILLGKSTSRLFGGLLLLLVQLPFALLAVALGGIHLLQVVKCYLLLAGFLFFACNVGLLGSVLAPRTGLAGLYTAVLGVGCWLLFKPADLPGRFSDVLSTGGQATSIGETCGFALVGGIAAFFAARLAFERFCGEQPGLATHRARRLFPAGLWRPSPGRAWQNAIAWRDFHFLHGGPRALAVKSVIYLAIAAFANAQRVFGFYWAPKSEVESTFALLCWVTLAIVAETPFSASRIFRRERLERTLGALALLPSGLEEMLRAKRGAVLISLAPLIACFVLLASPAFFLMVGEANGELIFWAGQAVLLLALQFAFHCYLVAWFSLRLRWGGLPISLALSLVGNAIILAFAVLLFQSAAGMMLIFGSVFAIVHMRRIFHRKLAEVAEEE